MAVSGSDRASDGRSVCVYAIVDRRPAAAIALPRGRERLNLIESGRIAAIVGEGPQEAAASAANLRRYDQLISALADRHPAVLPARFGTRLPINELIVVLEARHHALRAALGRVRGRVQMTVRILNAAAGNTTPSTRRLQGAPRPVASVGRGTTYLRARASEAASLRHIPGFEPVNEAVRRWIRDESIERRAGVATVYHLIPRRSAAVYRARLQAAADAANVRIVVSGPWPPYAFAFVE